MENLKASLKHVTELVTDVEEMLGLKMLKLEERLTEMEKRNEEQDIERAMNGNLIFPFLKLLERYLNTCGAKRNHSPTTTGK